MKWLLVLVFIWDGQIELRDYGFADLVECNRSRNSYVRSALETRKPVLVANCFPVSKTWNL